MKLNRKPERGGSHNFNIYSEKKGLDGDFDLNKISEVDTINEESQRDSSVKDLKFSDDEESGSSDGEYGDRRRAVEVDFDF